MKKFIALVSVMFLLVACSKEKSAITDSVAFMEDFKRVTTEYEANPTKENLKKVIDLVQGTNIKLNEDEKRILEQGMNDIENKVKLSSDDVKILWENNKDNAINILKEGKDSFIDKVKQSFSN